MKISAINYNNKTSQVINNKKTPAFKGMYEQYVSKFNRYGCEKVGERFSPYYNKCLILNTYRELIKFLKQFPDSCRTPLFDEVFKEPKYADNPMALLEDLHEGTGTIACKALSVEASKWHLCYNSPKDNAYPLIINDKDQKECLIIERVETPTISKIFDTFAEESKEKNGYYNIRFTRGLFHSIVFGLNRRGNLVFSNISEEVPKSHHRHYKADEFDKDFNLIKTYKPDLR